MKDKKVRVKAEENRQKLQLSMEKLEREKRIMEESFRRAGFSSGTVAEYGFSGGQIDFP